VGSTTHEQLYDAFGAYVRSQRHLAQLTLRQVAELARISNPYLSQIEHGLVLPSIAVLSALADALSVSAETMLLRAAGIVRPNTGDRQVQTEESIRHDPRLDNSQKQALLTVLASFVGSAPAAVLPPVPRKPVSGEPHGSETSESESNGSEGNESEGNESEASGSESASGGSVPAVVRRGPLSSTSTRPAAAGRVAGSR
jgi:transcriptional regulator with XRE-family HTH domain